jgi:hypothetical protein
MKVHSRPAQVAYDILTTSEKREASSSCRGSSRSVGGRGQAEGGARRLGCLY